MVEETDNIHPGEREVSSRGLVLDDGLGDGHARNKRRWVHPYHP